MAASWLAMAGTLQAFATDGTATQVLPPSFGATGLVDVAVGADDRIWFIDSISGGLGSVEPRIRIRSGSRSRGRRLSRELTEGYDGRLWVSHQGGFLQVDHHRRRSGST